MSNYIKALFMMLNAHKGQKDKGGNPYFLHPLRVSMATKKKELKSLPFYMMFWKIVISMKLKILTF